MSDPTLVVRLLKEQREDMKSLRHELNAFRQEVNERFDRVETRLTNLEHTVAGMASHLFALTNIVSGHERRIRKLEARSAK